MLTPSCRCFCRCRWRISSSSMILPRPFTATNSKVIVRHLLKCTRVLSARRVFCTLRYWLDISEFIPVNDRFHVTCATTVQLQRLMLNAIWLKFTNKGFHPGNNAENGLDQLRMNKLATVHNFQITM